MKANEKPKKKMKTKPTCVIDIQKAERLAGRGLSQKQIAQCLGISETSLYKYKKVSAEFKEALERGRSKGIAMVSNALFKKCLKGDVNAIKFYLSVVGRWKESKAIRVSGSIKTEDITEQMKKLSTEELMKIARLKEDVDN